MSNEEIIFMYTQVLEANLKIRVFLPVFVLFLSTLVVISTSIYREGF